MGILKNIYRDIEVWAIKDNYRLESDINSKVLAFAFGLSAEVEGNLISQRAKEALARILGMHRLTASAFVKRKMQVA